MRVVSILASFLIVGAALAAEPPTEVIVEVLRAAEPCRRKAEYGDTLSIHYTGRLFDSGSVFDSSYDRGLPFQMTLGRRQVINGLEVGLPGMCLGEKRKLTIPARDAYGKKGIGHLIPADSALIFEIELLYITGYDDDEREEL
ncbi:hypothetical protein BKA70DRAFT_1105650 [Coprinopsis sp. MPI-PUGE-AT-0042]|nr:hypothetical protein BKA70DRAFT_1105650 [Coprinopsis sp. MPI-PUGE-AT-0042]